MVVVVRCGGEKQGLVVLRGGGEGWLELVERWRRGLVRGLAVGGGGERCWCEVVVRASFDGWWQCELVIFRGDGR